MPRLRRALPGAVITAHPAGYHMLGPGKVDAFRFEQLAASGSTPTCGSA